MLRSSCVITSLLCAALTGWAQQTETVQVATFVPAGTLLRCTLDEPNFSSQTAQVGDPVLCHTTSIQMFGRPLIPRGAYLTAHLRDYRDPGHFFGKGWIQLEFTSLTLPGGNFPLNAKVVSVDRYRVNAQGQIKGHGHATRDAIEWTIPILWPMKVLTLPARGPRPTLKGETRIELRLMEDMMMPESANSALNGRTSRSSTSWPRTDDKEASLPTSRFGNVVPGNISLSAPQPPLSTPIDRFRTALVTDQAQPTVAQPRLTFLADRDGLVYLASDYWVDNKYLEYTTREGALEALALDALDIPLTRRLNAEQGVPFVLTAKHR
jgi:hypothetical protein